MGLFFLSCCLLKSESVSLSELSVCLQASRRLGEPTVSGAVKLGSQMCCKSRPQGTGGRFRSLGESWEGFAPSGSSKTVMTGAGSGYNLVYLTLVIWSGAPSLFQLGWNWLSNSVFWFLPYRQEHLVSVTGKING